MYHINKSDLEEREGGFTLVELLVVILIIGILAAVAIPAFLNQRQRANDAAVESDVKNLATQVETALIANPNPTNIEVSTHAGGTGTVILSAFVGGAPVAIPAKNHAWVSFDGERVGEAVVLSDGVVVRGSGSAQGFVLEGTHDNGGAYSASDDTWVRYDSSRGGLLSEAVSGNGTTPGDGDVAAPGDGDDSGESGVPAEVSSAYAGFASWAAARMPEGANIAEYNYGMVSFVREDDNGREVLDEEFYDDFDADKVTEAFYSADTSYIGSHIVYDGVLYNM